MLVLSREFAYTVCLPVQKIIWVIVRSDNFYLYVNGNDFYLLLRGFDWYKIINDSRVPGRMRKVSGMTLIPVGNTIVRKT